MKGTQETTVSLQLKEVQKYSGCAETGETRGIKLIPHTPADDGLESGIMVEEQHCSLCDTVLDTRKTPNENHEHTYGDWIMIKDPTCTEKGERECVCTGCGDRKTEEVKALGYLYVSKGGDVYEFTAEKERFIGVSTFFR